MPLGRTRRAGGAGEGTSSPSSSSPSPSSVAGGRSLLASPPWRKRALSFDRQRAPSHHPLLSAAPRITTKPDDIGGAPVHQSFPTTAGTPTTSRSATPTPYFSAGGRRLATSLSSRRPSMDAASASVVEPAGPSSSSNISGRPSVDSGPSAGPTASGLSGWVSSRRRAASPLSPSFPPPAASSSWVRRQRAGEADEGETVEMIRPPSPRPRPSYDGTEVGSVARSVGSGAMAASTSSAGASEASTVRPAKASIDGGGRGGGGSTSTSTSNTGTPTGHATSSSTSGLSRFFGTRRRKQKNGTKALSVDVARAADPQPFDSPPLAVIARSNGQGQGQEEGGTGRARTSRPASASGRSAGSSTLNQTKMPQQLSPNLAGQRKRAPLGTPASDGSGGFSFPPKPTTPAVDAEPSSSTSPFSSSSQSKHSLGRSRSLASASKLRQFQQRLAPPGRGEEGGGGGGGGGRAGPSQSKPPASPNFFDWQWVGPFTGEDERKASLHSPSLSVPLAAMPTSTTPTLSLGNREYSTPDSRKTSVESRTRSPSQVAPIRPQQRRHRTTSLADRLTSFFSSSASATHPADQHGQSLNTSDQVVDLDAITLNRSLPADEQDHEDDDDDDLSHPRSSAHTAAATTTMTTTTTSSRGSTVKRKASLQRSHSRILPQRIRQFSFGRRPSSSSGTLTMVDNLQTSSQAPNADIEKLKKKEDHHNSTTSTYHDFRSSGSAAVLSPAVASSAASPSDVRASALLQKQRASPTASTPLSIATASSPKVARKFSLKRVMAPKFGDFGREGVPGTPEIEGWKTPKIEPGQESDAGPAEQNRSENWVQVIADDRINQIGLGLGPLDASTGGNLSGEAKRMSRRLQLLPTPDLSGSPMSGRALLREAGIASRMSSNPPSRDGSATPRPVGGETFVRSETQAAPEEQQLQQQQQQQEQETEPGIDTESELVYARDTQSPALGLQLNPTDEDHQGRLRDSRSAPFVSGLDALSTGWASPTTVPSETGRDTPVARRDEENQEQDDQKPVQHETEGRPEASMSQHWNDASTHTTSSNSSSGYNRPQSLISADGNDTPIVRLQRLVVDTTEDEEGSQAQDTRARDSDFFFRPLSSSNRQNHSGGNEPIESLQSPSRSSQALPGMAPSDAEQEQRSISAETAPVSSPAMTAASESALSGEAHTVTSMHSSGSSTLNARLFSDRMRAQRQNQQPQMTLMSGLSSSGSANTPRLSTVASASRSRELLFSADDQEEEEMMGRTSSSSSKRTSVQKPSNDAARTSPGEAPPRTSTSSSAAGARKGANRTSGMPSETGTIFSSGSSSVLEAEVSQAQRLKAVPLRKFKVEEWARKVGDTAPAEEDEGQGPAPKEEKKDSSKDSLPEIPDEPLSSADEVPLTARQEETSGVAAAVSTPTLPSEDARLGFAPMKRRRKVSTSPKSREEGISLGGERRPSNLSSSSSVTGADADEMMPSVFNYRRPTQAVTTELPSNSSSMSSLKGEGGRREASASPAARRSKRAASSSSRRKKSEKAPISRIFALDDSGGKTLRPSRSGNLVSAANSDDDEQVQRRGIVPKSSEVKVAGEVKKSEGKDVDEHSKGHQRSASAKTSSSASPSHRRRRGHAKNQSSGDGESSPRRKASYLTSEEAALAKRRERAERERLTKEKEKERQEARQAAYARRKKADPLLAARLALVGLADEPVTTAMTSTESRLASSSAATEVEEEKPEREARSEATTRKEQPINIESKTMLAFPTLSTAEATRDSPVLLPRSFDSLHTKNKPSTASVATVQSMASLLAALDFPQPPVRDTEAQRSDDGTVLSRAGFAQWDREALKTIEATAGDTRGDSNDNEPSGSKATNVEEKEGKGPLKPTAAALETSLRRARSVSSTPTKSPRLSMPAQTQATAKAESSLPAGGGTRLEHSFIFSSKSPVARKTGPIEDDAETVTGSPSESTLDVHGHRRKLSREATLRQSPVEAKRPEVVSPTRLSPSQSPLPSTTASTAGINATSKHRSQVPTIERFSMVVPLGSAQERNM